MKTETRHFYYISHPHDRLIIDIHVLKNKACPILWNNKGLYCIISRQKVQNFIDILQDQGNLPILNKKIVNIFHWDDGELIDAKMALKLLS